MVIAVVQNNRFMFNLSAPVGAGRANEPPDVELVRFGYKMMRQNPHVNTRPNAQRLMEFIDGMAPYGPFDDDLQFVIDEEQNLYGGTKDGCVSPARGFQGVDSSYDGEHIWIIEALNNNMRLVAADIYPRTDKHSLCGPVARNSVLNIFL